MSFVLSEKTIAAGYGLKEFEYISAQPMQRPWLKHRQELKVLSGM